MASFAAFTSAGASGVPADCVPAPAPDPAVAAAAPTGAATVGAPSTSGFNTASRCW
jgi:hypothetical protein